MKASTEKHLSELLERYPKFAALSDPVSRCVELTCESHLTGGKVLVCGNGGSAADSEHIVGELMKGFVLPRRLPDDHVSKLVSSGFDGCEEIASNLQQGVAAVALTGHPALSTAILNDTAPYIAFAQQVYVLGRPGDVLLAISTSGNAKNVVAAAKVARAFGLRNVGFTGSRPSALDGICDVMIKAPETETFKVQECHLPIYHTICLMVEEELFG